MVGLIWVVQVVHYPMLSVFSQHSPAIAVVDHQRRITWVVGPLMAVEGVSALILLFDRPSTMGVLTAWVAAMLVGLALVSTVLIQVPLHAQLAVAHDAEAARRLIASNWVRTVAWTAKGLLLLVVLAT
jgi:hypothetical protein